MSVGTTELSVGRAALAIVSLALAACGSNAPVPVIPHLPGDGDDNTAKLVDGTDPSERDGLPEPWASSKKLFKPPTIVPTKLRKIDKPIRFTLDNGLTILLVHRENTPLISMQLGIRAGRADVERDKIGTSRLAAMMLTRGTKNRSHTQLVIDLDRTATSLSARAAYEATVVSCNAHVGEAVNCFSIVSDMVMNPLLDDRALIELRAQLLDEIDRRFRNLRQLANTHFQSLLFGQQHARGWPMSEATVMNIEKQDLQQWFKKWFAPNNATLVIAGEFNVEAVRKEVQRAFSPWKQRTLPKRTKRTLPELKDKKIRIVNVPDQKTAHIRVGHLGVSHRDGDYYDVAVFDHVMGGTEASRLGSAVTQLDPNGAVTSAFDANVEPGAFTVGAVVTNKHTVPAIKALLNGFEKMAETGPTKAELRRATGLLTAQHAYRFETASALASAWMAVELQGLGADYLRDFPNRIAEVSTETATDAAHRRLKPKQAVIVVVGNESELAPQFQDAGWSYEKLQWSDPITTYERGFGNAEAEARGKAIIEKALKAKGGRKRIANVKTMELRGSATLLVPSQQGVQKIPARITRWLSLPGNMRLDMSLFDGKRTVTTVLTDTEGWVRDQQGSKSKLDPLPKEQIAVIKVQLWRDHEFILLRALAGDAEVAAVPDMRLDGKSYTRVRIRRKDRKLEVVAFIDKKTNLLRRLSFDDQGSPTVEDYGNYKPVQGIQVAHLRSSINRAQGRLTSTITKVTFNKKPPPKLFAKPKTAASKP